MALVLNKLQHLYSSHTPDMVFIEPFTVSTSMHLITRTGRQLFCKKYTDYVLMLYNNIYYGNTQMVKLI